MKILVACEESQAVTVELRRLGHEAYSCDVVPCSGGHPEWHLQVDALELLKMRWDMIMAFPPCTYLTNAGSVRLRVKGEINQERMAKAVEAVLNITLAAIALAAAYAVYYIRLAATKVKKQTQQIEDESARALLDNAIEDVRNLAETAVGAMEQTTASALRDEVKLGKANRGELIILGKQVFADVKSQVGPEAQRVITENLGSFDKYLRDVIEDAVRKVKQQDPYLTLNAETLIEDGYTIPGVNDKTAEAEQ